MYLVAPRHQLQTDLDDASSQDLKIEGLARLDNRSELGSSLGISDAALNTLVDTALILEAYRKWEEACVDHLLGDFAFSIIDSASGDLFCARDHLGIAPFYYFLSEQHFIFADNIRQLIADQLVPAVLDDNAVCCYLRDGEFYHREKTFYRHIKKLPPGHVMKIESAESFSYPYWSLENCGAVSSVSQQSHQECSDQLRKLMVQAIATRIPEKKPFGLHLSGGLDSSGIAAICRTDLKNEPPNVHAYTWNFQARDEREQSLDEVSSVVSVAEHLELPLHYSSMSVEQLHALLCTRNIALGDTTDCWSEWSVRDRAIGDGVTTILSGWGGDQFISHHGTHRYAELVTAGKPVQSLLEIWRAVKPSRRPLRRFFSVTRRLVLSPIFTALFRRVPSRSSYLMAARPEIQALATELPSEIEGNITLSIRGDQLDAGNNLHLLNRVESWSAACEGKNLSYTYPLLDKRVVEFAVGMASQHYCSNGVTRYSFREAIKDLLPEEIVYSTSKFEPRRAQRDLSMCIAAIDQWKKGRSEAKEINRFIDDEKLHRLIDELPRESNRLDDDIVERVGVIIRSIFVINLCEQAP
ncbi:MAG: asparagine synthetase B [Halioglobus sp.]